VVGPWQKKQDSCSSGLKDLVESSCREVLIIPLCLLSISQVLTTYYLLLYIIIIHVLFFVWEFLWVSCPPNSFSHNFPQIDHDCVKSTNLPTHLWMYPTCSDTTDFSLLIYLLYYDHIPSGLLFVLNLESQMSNLHMFIHVQLWVGLLYLSHNSQVSPHHLIIEDVLIGAISWLDVGTLFLFFPLPWGVTCFSLY
jgi:hypothetical protein